jgi:hypothetical protein
MTNPTVVLTRVAIALAAASLVAGCSGPAAGTGATPNASASAEAAAGTAMREVAKCLRSHGYPNAPDPVQDSEGNWGFHDAPPGSMPGRGVSTPCDDLARTAKNLSRGDDKERASAADMSKLRAYAACMRKNGVADWPDPGPGGDFEVPARLRPPHGEAIWQPVDEKCHAVRGEVDLSIALPAGSGGNGAGGGK